GGGRGAAGVRVGGREAGYAHGHGHDPLAPDPPAGGGTVGPGVLPVRGPAPRDSPGPRDGGGEAVGDRVVLRGGQAGDGAGRVRGADLARLVPAHHALDASAGLPGGGAGRGAPDAFG